MNSRIGMGTSFSVAMMLLMSGPSVNAQLLRLKKTGPNREPQQLIPNDPRHLAATESQAFPVKPEFEMPLKVSIKPTVKRAHFEPRQQGSLREVVSASKEPSQTTEPIDDVATPNDLHFAPPPRETEFELPRVLPNKKSQPAVESQDEALPDQTTPSSELELPSPPAAIRQAPTIQPPEEEQSTEETIETQPVPKTDSQPAEETPEIQPAKPKPTTPPQPVSDYEEPVIVPMPRTAKEESVAPVHLPRLDEIDVRDAIRLKPTNDGSSSIQAPPNQAHLMLGMRPPVYYGASAWPGLQMNRNSYPFCHKPLHFENPNLERCGYHYGCLTTPISMAFFYGTIPTLPYRHGAEPPWECVRSLPDCRYGHRFGYDAYLPPLSLRGAALQTAAVVGMIYAVP